MSMESSQFHQKPVCWKFSQQLHSVTRKGEILLIFLSLALGTALGTTYFLKAAVLYTYLPQCGPLESFLPLAHRKIKCCLIINISMPCKISFNPSHYLSHFQSSLVLVFSLKTKSLGFFFFFGRDFKDLSVHLRLKK